MYISTATSNETFALRSVNGIGVVDLVDEFNNDLKNWKKTKNSVIPFIILGIPSLLGAFYCFSAGSTGCSIFLFVISMVFIIPTVVIMQSTNNKEPTLMSAVRIMMNGGNRDFKFDKSSSDANKIAEFVAKVEETLTAYHKNNS